MLGAAVNGVYGAISNSILGWFTYPAYFSDEIINPNASGLALDAQENTYTAEDDYPFWSGYYAAIYNANAILEATENPDVAIAADSLKQARGEALFLRGYCYFNLVNFYGDVPLVRTTDVRITAFQPKDSVNKIYKAIIEDLEKAADLLTEPYTSGYRWKVNKHAVNALLSKIYLYTQDWVKAEARATSVISSPLYTLEADLNNVFLANSKETIWQLWNQNGFSSISTNYVPSNTTIVNFRVRKELLQSFEAGDKRSDFWVKAGTGASASFFYPYKYKLRAAATGNNAEYIVQLRLADIYLVRSEARAQQDNLIDGNKDLNEVRRRAGFTVDVNYTSRESLVNAILMERRKELMFEGAERWFDLKRSGQAKAVLAPLKTNFQERSLLLPLSNDNLNSNPNLDQNPDYY